ncbi:hypothetical protein [Shewanella sp. CAL98-MNA-CIBAN-0140]
MFVTAQLGMFLHVVQQGSFVKAGSIYDMENSYYQRKLWRQ